MLSCAPLGFQYGAEIAYPAPEGTSTGMLMLAGQISGIVFIFGMDMLKSPTTGSMSISMFVLIILMLFAVLICTQLRESPLIQKEKAIS